MSRSISSPRAVIISVLAMGAAPTLSACTVESNGMSDTPEEAENTAQVSQRLDQSKELPRGLVCGMRHGYTSSTSDVTSFGCDGYGTYGVAPGFEFIATGDWGMPSTGGFFHQELYQSTNAGYWVPSDELKIPRGTVMGLGHSRNRPVARMIGPTDMTERTSCPRGWTKKTAFDAGGGGAFWFWCEYNDPYGRCPPGACRTNVPVGTVCGLGYPGQVHGVCEANLDTCPAGWTRRGPRDELASLNLGLRWCERNF
jgi:hypothetical protein